MEHPDGTGVEAGQGRVLSRDEVADGGSICMVNTKVQH